MNRPFPRVRNMRRENIENVLVMGRSGAGKQPRIDVLMDEFGFEQLSTGDIFRHYMKMFNESGYSGELDGFWDDSEGWFRNDEMIFDAISTSLKEGGTGRNEILLGLKAKYFVDSGKYVPDRITNSMFEDFFSKSNYRGKVLDGYPRTVGQARFLMELASSKNFSVDFAVLVDNSEDAIVSRLLGRRICPDCKKVFHMEFKPPRDGRFCTKCGSKVITRSDDTEEKIRSRLNEFTTKTEPAIEYLRKGGVPIISVPGHLEVFSPETVRRSVMEQVEKLLD